MMKSDITYKKKHISLGSYPDESSALLARKEAALALGRRGLIPDRALPPGAIMLGVTGHLPEISDYDICTVLPFEKWVCLINFRDNAIYSHNPIYLKKDYFEYWLSPDRCLKFSRDDLFYYSSHKISTRGGHLFVAEFGMQTSIMSRYGIHSFSVAGRDYIFVNGDDTDLRYENIEVINHYRGVFFEETKKGPVYTVKIHIKGTVIVGRYPDEITAAIAYNKAADTLIAAGCKRNFETNYIDGISETAYREIYQSTAINDVTVFLR